MLDPVPSKTIVSHTGRPLRNVVAVAASCPAGHAAVVTCHPLRRRGGRVTPFPTLYWLTCPRLAAAAAHLERAGAIAQLQDELDGDAALRAALARDHQDYIARRWDLLSPEDRLFVSEQGLLADFQQRGIGGMANHAAIKCLHLHLAHHLATGNSLGAILCARYGLSMCP